jgi:hypothetical protein
MIKRTTLVSAAIAIHCAFLANPPGEPDSFAALSREASISGTLSRQLALTFTA